LLATNGRDCPIFSIMPRGLLLGAVLAAILCLVTVFASPATDIPVTALRARQIAMALFLALAAAAGVIAALAGAAAAPVPGAAPVRGPGFARDSLLDLTCSRLC
jgi:hypothetical protein